MSDFTNIEAANTYALNLTHVESTDIFVNGRGEALFAFVLPTSAVCCVQMPAQTTSSSSRLTSSNALTTPIKFEINQPNLVKRLWSGLKRGSGAGGSLGGAGAQDAASQFAAFRFFQLGQATYLISLCKDFKLRIWCIKVIFPLTIL